jgi:hypothetical protein
MYEPINLTWKMALRPWWAHIWRAILIGVALQLYVRGIFYVLAPKYMAAYRMHHHLMQDPSIIMVLRVLGGCAISYALIAIVFQRSYKHFSIEPRNNSDTPIMLSARNMMKIWWSLLWRRLLLVLGIVVVVGLLLGLLFIGGKAAGLSKLGFAAVAIFIILVAGVAACYFGIKIYRIVMQKRYSDFYLAIVLRESSITTS